MAPPRFRNNPRKRPTSNTATSNEAADELQNPVLKAFHGYARELDDKHDRHERIVKLSRDITIEAKRIIFLLHTIDGRKHNRTKVIAEAKERLNKLIEVNFQAVAKELLHQDPYQYRSAYSPGLQEFIEAYSFMEYFESGEDKKTADDEANEAAGELSDWQKLQERMQYEEVIAKEEKMQDEQTEETNEDKRSVEVKAPQKFQFIVDPTEYILGVSDLTGELMRRCINSLGSGETDSCLDACKVLQKFYTGYISLNAQRRSRELSRKIYTMRQSVLKAENVCYNVKVRGGEAAKWGAVYESKPADDADEGFF